MKYFITGATGFIGGEVARQLRAAGHEVVALVRSPEKAGKLTNLGIQLHKGDITNRDTILDAMQGADGVFHLAAWYKIGARDKSQAYQINVEGTRNVLETMRDLAIPKGVYTSTVGIYSDTHGRVVDESYRINGPFISEYERTKWLAHYEVAQPMIREGLPLVIVMPGLVYGPGDTSNIHEMLLLYVRRRLPVAPLKTAFCWSHVEDTARAHLLAMEKGKPGEEYIITGQICTFIDALKIGERLTGIPVPKVLLPPSLIKATAGVVSLLEKVIPLPDTYRAETLRTIAGTTYIASSAKAQRDLGATFRPLEEGFCELVDCAQAEISSKQQRIAP